MRWYVGLDQQSFERPNNLVARAFLLFAYRYRHHRLTFYQREPSECVRALLRFRGAIYQAMVCRLNDEVNC